MPRHHLDTGFLRAVSREKLMVRLQVEHAGSFPRIYGRTLVQMPRDPIFAARAADAEEIRLLLLRDEKRHAPLATWSSRLPPNSISTFATLGFADDTRCQYFADN